MARLCTVDKPMSDVGIRTLAAHQLPDPASESDRGTVKDYVGDTLTAIGRTQKGLATLSPPPTADGRTLLAAYGKELGTLHGKFTGYAKDAARFPPSGLNAVYTLSRLDMVQLKGVAVLVHGKPLAPVFARTPQCAL